MSFYFLIRLLRIKLSKKILCVLMVCFTLFFSNSPAHTQRPRARDLGIRIGTFQPGPHNAITDVPGVLVGHVTLIRGKGKLVVGQGPVRTGVTAIIPHSKDIYQNQVFAATEVLNGNGEITGTDWINERGLLEVPILLTNTLSVGTAYNGVISYIIKQNPNRVPLPVVAECYDGNLNDIAGRHVREIHVIQAIESARNGPVDEGSVGAGTGMRMYGYKAGIGTASRILTKKDGGYTVGILVNANSSSQQDWLRVNGIHVGKEISAQTPPASRDGSIIVIIATDAPLLPIQLRRLCKRAILGLGRTGKISHPGSGDFILAFSTAQYIPRKLKLFKTKNTNQKFFDTFQKLREKRLTPLFQVVIEATEEAVINALCVAETMVGRDNQVMPGLPHDQLVKILKKHGRIE